MVLVDSSAWIEALSHPDSSVFGQVNKLLEDQACTCGVVIQEVLQGLRELSVIREVSMRMSLLPYLEANPETYLAAAYLFRRCRHRGIRVHTVDALIMALAIQHGVPVFTLDSDFAKVASIEHGLHFYPK